MFCPSRDKLLPDMRRLSVKQQIDLPKPDLRSELNILFSQSGFLEHLSLRCSLDRLVRLYLSANERPKGAFGLFSEGSDRGVIQTHQKKLIGIVEEYDFDGFSDWINHRF
jgi:hypothetical protein